MRTIFYIAFLHQCWSAFAHNGPAVPGPFRAPGRLDRMMPRQPGRDCGSYTLNCQGAEGACNNACYHINCNINSGPNRDRVTYIGPGADAENSRNRQQSGCAASPCGNYPFSQKFRDPNLNTPNVHCDEWPMAASIQNNFVAGTLRNSLRCISGSENTSAGSRIGKFIQDLGPGFPNRNPQCAGPLQRGDYFKVDFDISTADHSKLKFCIGTGTIMCGSDGFQFAMTDKGTQNGKISAPYDPFGRPPGLQPDNRYALQNTIYPDLFQCSVELARTGDDSFEAALFNWRNTEISRATQQITGATGTATFTGLPLDLNIGKTGKLATLVTFEYGNSPNAQAAYFKWDMDTQGDGRGPATDAGFPLRFCKVDTVGNKQNIQCWFPCYDR